MHDEHRLCPTGPSRHTTPSLVDQHRSRGGKLTPQRRPEGSVLEGGHAVHAGLVDVPGGEPDGGIRPHEMTGHEHGGDLVRARVHGHVVGEAERCPPVPDPALLQGARGLRGGVVRRDQERVESPLGPQRQGVQVHEVVAQAAPLEVQSHRHRHARDDRGVAGPRGALERPVERSAPRMEGRPVARPVGRLLVPHEAVTGPGHHREAAHGQPGPGGV